MNRIANLLDHTVRQYAKQLAMILICVCAFFVNNCLIVPDIMESRNIITAREMVYEGHWLIPTMNGELRLEKPPLPTWLTALTEYIQPDSLALQRGMAGIAALLLVWYFWRFARKVLYADPIIPTVLLCTCYNIILMGRTASWDIYCHAFMMGGIYHLARAMRQAPHKGLHYLAAGLFTGLSILSKGPVSPYALLLPFLLSWGFVERPSMKGHWRYVAMTVVVALLLGTWWYGYVHFSQAEKLAAVVEKESSSWANHNVRPWWYYWKFFLETGIWSLLLLTSLFLPLKDKWRRDKRWLLTAGWMLASLVLLSLMPEKKSRYLLPLLIPASYMMGCMVAWWELSLGTRYETKADRWAFRINAGLIALAVGALPSAMEVMAYAKGAVSLEWWIAFTCFALVILSTLIWSLIQLRPMGMLAAVAVLFMAAECWVLPSLEHLINNPDRKSIALTRTIEGIEDVPFYHAKDVPLRIELVYAANRHIRPVDTSCADSILCRLPMVLLTHEGAGATLPDELWEKADSVYLGHFDDNPRPKGNARHTDEFVYHLTLIYPPTE